MSDINMARRTAAEVFFGGLDVSTALREYLISITYTDNEEDEADDLQIKIEDREDVWLIDWLPKAVEAAAAASRASAAKSTTTYKVSAKGGVNVRSGASTKQKKLATLTYGAEIEVIAIVKGWASVVQGGVDAAFIEAKSLTSSGTGSATKAAEYAQVKQGSSGADVKDMQTLLISIDYSCGPKGADGIFGSKTLQAVKKFQKDFKLKVDGICGPFTWTALIKATQKTKTSESSKGLRIQSSFVRKNWNSDGGDQVLDCGEFELDSVDGSGPPSTLTIKATSLPYSSTVRQTLKSKAWENIRLSQIAREITDSSGMACMYESAYDPSYARVEQLSESDISLLSRLCHNAGISLKVTNNIVVLFDQAAYEAKAPVITIPRGKAGGYTKWKISTGSADTKYAVCRVSCINPATGAVIEGFAYADDYNPDSDKNQCLEIAASVRSVGEAEALAEKRLRLHNKYEKKVVLTFPGNPDLLAGITAVLDGWGFWSGKYIIKQAQHRVDSSGGYITQITLRRVLEGY